jgi:hypothetical protein
VKIWSWRQAILKSELESTTKLLLLALSTYMNDHGEGCYPSQDTLSRDTSLSTRSVINHIALAVQAGFLIKEKRNLQGKKWDANEYRASIPSDLEPDSPQEDGVQQIHPISNTVTNPQVRGEADSPDAEAGGVKELHVRGEPVAHKLSSELSKDSVSNETGGTPPQGDLLGDVLVDFKKVLFTEGLKLIGGPTDSNRSMMGKWIRDHGEKAVVNAMLEAQKQSVIGPKDYIIKILKQGGKKHGTANQPNRFAEQDYTSNTNGFAGA